MYVCFSELEGIIFNEYIQASFLFFSPSNSWYNPDRWNELKKKNTVMCANILREQNTFLATRDPSEPGHSSSQAPQNMGIDKPANPGGLCCSGLLTFLTASIPDLACNSHGSIFFFYLELTERKISLAIQSKQQSPYQIILFTSSLKSRKQEYLAVTAKDLYENQCTFRKGNFRGDLIDLQRDTQAKVLLQASQLYQIWHRLILNLVKKCEFKWAHICCHWCRRWHFNSIAHSLE